MKSLAEYYCMRYASGACKLSSQCREAEEARADYSSKNASCMCCFRRRSPLSSLLFCFRDDDFLSNISRCKISSARTQETKVSTQTQAHHPQHERCTYSVNYPLLQRLWQVENRARDVVVLDVLLEARANGALDRFQLLDGAPRLDIQKLILDRERDLRRFSVLQVYTQQIQIVRHSLSRYLWV